VLKELWLVCGSLILQSLIWNAGTAVRGGRAINGTQRSFVRQLLPVRTLLTEHRPISRGPLIQRLVGLGTEAGVLKAGDTRLARAIPEPDSAIDNSTCMLYASMLSFHGTTCMSAYAKLHATMINRGNVNEPLAL
jgi:hypothetical protein